MKILNQDIKAGTFKPVYCLYGEEAFLKRSYKNRLKEAVVGDDTMNFNLFQEKEAQPEDIIAAADTMPFFADRRLILIEDSGLFKREADKLVEYLPRMPETTVIVFVESQMDKRSRLYKKVKELGYAVELGRQPEKELKDWVLRILDGEGKQISVAAMELFLSMTGDDMENIRMELEKLISFIGEKKAVYPEDVEAICTRQITGKIFDMISAVAQKRQRQALDYYDDLLALKEPPMRILFLLARQFAQLLQVKELAGQGLGKSEIAKKTGLNPFIAGKIMNQAASFSSETLKRYIELCADSEERVKTGRLTDRLAVELLIVEFSREESSKSVKKQ